MISFIQNDIKDIVKISYEPNNKAKNAISEVKTYLSCIKKNYVIGENYLVIDNNVFFLLFERIKEIVSCSGIDFSTEVKLNERIVKSLSRADNDIDDHNDVNIDNVQQKLYEIDFKRKLTEQQARNVVKLCKRNRGASFSVPGAGKSTEALAYYALKKKENSILFIVAPLSTFDPWDEQLSECFGSGESFTRFEKAAKIDSYLASNPKFSICNYEKIKDHGYKIKPFLQMHAESCFMYLDESHKIMSNGKNAKAVLTLATIPSHKLILSGTPLPQCNENLIPQMNFLYPTKKFNENNIVEFTKEVFVRTTKSELGLPKENVVIKQVEMSPIQKEAWTLIRGKIVQELKPLLEKYKSMKNIDKRATLRQMGKYVMTLLRLASRPQGMLNKFAELNFTEMKEQFLNHEKKSAKYLAVLQRANEVVSQGKKVIVWSIFRSNVEELANDLIDHGAKYIHGGVDTETRENNIRAFKEDPRCMVLVANPAASSEGISLHKACQHAIYLDRSFNAAQYLQSKDRINRIGMPEGTHATIEIFESKNTIDQRVNDRLDLKINNMAAVLNDDSLRIEPEYEDADVDYDSESSISLKDIEAIF